MPDGKEYSIRDFAVHTARKLYIIFSLFPLHCFATAYIAHFCIACEDTVFTYLQLVMQVAILATINWN